MNTNNNSKRIHPLIAGAAVSVMVASLTGVAAMTGLLPNSHGESKAVAESAQATQAAPVKTARDKPAAVAKIAKPVASQQAAFDDEDSPPAQPRRISRSDAVYRSPDYSQNMVQVAQPARICHDCGRVESVHTVQSQADPSGVGVVGGAVVGGLLGNQVGGGHGRQAMTVVGAIGGALAGNQIEKQATATHSFETTVHMNNGSSRTFAQATQPNWRDGDHVRIVDGAVQMNG